MTTPKPLGTQPPGPNWLLIGLRLAWLVSLALLWNAVWLHRWAQAVHAHAHAARGDLALQALLPLADLVRPVVSSPWLAGVAQGGAVLVLGELALGALLIGWHAGRPPRAAGTYLRIRAARTPRSRGSTTGARPGGEDWYRAVHDLMLRDDSGRLSCTISGRPDTPAELGVRLVGGTEKTRAIWVQAVSKIMVGLVPDTLIEEQPDPLGDGLTPGAWLAWGEIGLRRGPEHPLRFGDTAEQADLLRPLVAAVSPPTGVTRTQVQLILRPRQDWGLTEGWRAAGLRRLLALKAKQVHAVGDEAATLEQKLHSPVYNATLRVVAAGATKPAVEQAVAQIVAVQGQYNARSGTGAQGLRLLRQGTLQVPLEPARQRASGWIRLLGLVLTVLAALPLLRGQALGMVPALGLPVRPLPGAPVWLLLPLLALLIPCAADLSALVLARRMRGAPARHQVERVRAHLPRPTPPPPVLWPFRAWRPPAILGPDELRGLWHLPTPSLSGLVLALPNLYLPPPDIAFIPPDATDRVPLGTARHSDGTRGEVGPRLFDLNQIFHMTGGMGAGKSQMFSNVMRWLLHHRHGYTYFEGKPGDKSNLLHFARQLLSLADEGRLVIIDPLDVAWPVGINPIARLDLTRPDAADQALGTLDSVLARLDPETWGHAPGMQQYLQMSTLLVVLAEPWPTIAHIKQCLIDEKYRARLLKRCTNIEVKTFWEITFPNTGSSQKTSLDALLRRFDQLLVPEMVRHMITGSTFRFEQAMAERWIVMICVPTDRLGNIARALAMLLFQSFALAAFEREGTALSRVPYPLILDEFQELIKNAATHDVERAITQFRSQGTPGMFAHQGVSQLGVLEDLMFTNGQNRVIPTILGDDAAKYARLYGASGVTAEDITGQQPDHRYAAFLVDRRPTGLFSMEPLPWPQPLPIDVPPAPPLPWQTVLPEQADPLDPWLARLVYSDLPSPGAAVAVLAKADGATWAHILARWEVLRATHRERILAEPGLIPDRMERQRWLSRLLAAQPWILAASAYQRQRWEVAPGEAQTSVSPPPRAARPAHAGGSAAANGVPLPRGVVTPVSGATPPPEERPATPMLATDRPTTERVIFERGKRRVESDVVNGYHGLKGETDDDDTRHDDDRSPGDGDPVGATHDR